MTHEIEALAEWLADGGGTDVALASSGVYWQPIHNLLEDCFRLWLVNAQHIKHVPSRKTDVKDAEWLAQLLHYGLLKPSCIPEQAQHELRDLVRYCQTVGDERSRITNRVQKVLEDANLKLASVAKYLHGTSAQAILHALLAGERDPVQLADLARGRLRQKRAALEPALVGRLRPHHCFVLTHVLTQLDVLDEEMTAIEAQIEVQTNQLSGARDVTAWLDHPRRDLADRHPDHCRGWRRSESLCQRSTADRLGWVRARQQPDRGRSARRARAGATDISAAD